MSDELSERVADIIAKVWDEEGSIIKAADAAIALIRAEVLEEAAKVAEIYQYDELCDERGGNIIKPSAAIRDLKGRP